MPAIFGFKLCEKSTKQQRENLEMLGEGSEDGVVTRQRRGVTWHQMCRTLVLVLTFATWGLGMSVQAMTLEDLRIRLNTTAYGISFALAISIMGHMWGGFFAVIPDRFAKSSDLHMGMAVLAAAVAFVYIPHCTALDQLGICFLVTTLTFNFVQAAAHSQITALWSKGAKSARYALYFGFSIGATLGPFVSAPFVSGKRVYDPVAAPEVAVNSTDEANYDITTAAPHFYILNSPSRNESTIEYAYLIVFTLLVFAAALMVLNFFMGLFSNTLNRLEKRGQEQSWRGVLYPSSWAGGSGIAGVTITLLFIAWSLLQNCIAHGTKRYLVQFAMLTGLTHHEASMLNIAVVGAGIMSRGLGIAASRFVSIRLLMLIIVAGQTLTALLCMILASKFTLALYILAPILGFFREAALPTLYAWTGHYVIIYGVLFGITDIIGTLAMMLYMPLQEHLFYWASTSSIFHTAFGLGLLQLILTLFMNWYGAHEGSRRAKKLANKVESKDFTNYVPCLDSVDSSSDCKSTLTSSKI